MIKLDDNLLNELGLGALVQNKPERDAFLRHMYETLEMRVGTRLAEKMNEQQMAEFEQFINSNDEQGAFRWLETNFPNYRDVVAEEFDKLKSEIKPLAPQIVASSNANASAAGQQMPTAAPAQPQNHYGAPAQPAAPSAPAGPDPYAPPFGQGQDATQQAPAQVAQSFSPPVAPQPKPQQPHFGQSQPAQQQQPFGQPAPQPAYNHQATAYSQPPAPSPAPQPAQFGQSQPTAQAGHDQQYQPHPASNPIAPAAPHFGSPAAQQTHDLVPPPAPQAHEPAPAPSPASPVSPAASYPPSEPAFGPPSDMPAHTSPPAPQHSPFNLPEHPAQHGNGPGAPRHPDANDK